MATRTISVLSLLLSLAAAAPAASEACAAASVITVTATAAAASSSCTTITTTVLSTNIDQVVSAIPSATVAATETVNGDNVQLFTGTLGGPPPPVISSSGDRPFSVDGSTFVNSGAAIQRSCDVQHNACSNAANSGQLAGGTGQCDTQDTACRAANNLSRRRVRRGVSLAGVSPRVLLSRAALDLGSCSDTTILFEAGLDGRNTDAFIAENQQDFNHGSALNIGVIAGFICQRLGSSCGAPDDTLSTCTSASAAAVATTQNQAAADAFNGIMGSGSSSDASAAASAAVSTTAAAVAAASSTVADLASSTVGAVAVTITACA